MNKNTYTYDRYAYQTAGSLALAPTPLVRLSVIEGGQASRTHATKQNPESSRTRTRDHARASQPHEVPSKGWHAVVALILCVIVLMFATTVSDAFIEGRRAASVANLTTTVVKVMPGDSLWALAEAHGVDGLRTDEVVSWIKDYNGLSAATLYVGDTVVVPA